MSEQKTSVQSPQKQKYGRLVFISSIILLLAVCILLTVFYTGYTDTSQPDSENSVETEVVLKSLFDSNYVLYKDLYEKQNGTPVTYGELYLQEFPDNISELMSGELNTDYILEDDPDYFKNIHQKMENMFNSICEDTLESTFNDISEYYDYRIEDLNSDINISNNDSRLNSENADIYRFYIEIEYDSNGIATTSVAKGTSSDALLRQAAKLARNKNLLNYFFDQGRWDYQIPDGFRDTAEVNAPKNCRIIYGITHENYVAALQNYYISDTMIVNYDINAMIYSVSDAYLLMLFLLLLLSVFLPWKRIARFDIGSSRLFALPLEAIAGLFLLVYAYSTNLATSIFYLLNAGESGTDSWLVINNIDLVTLFRYFFKGLMLFILLAIFWYGGLCLHAILTMGFGNYIRERSLIYRFFPMTKRKLMHFYDTLEHFDVSKNAKKIIIKLILINAVILFIISSLWFGGFMITIVYSILLYFLLKIYVSRLQSKYGILLSKINEISEGNLNVEIKEDLGIFEPFKLHLLRIQEGFRSSVEQEVKSQRMKAELITNVSHDLKTPLTAIITYINLLKEENLTDMQRREYLDTLDRKSLRLKALIEDLFEVSKANSGNVTLSPMDIDICNLVKQVELEMSDKIAENNLDVRVSMPEHKVIAFLDSQKTYRVYENFFINICKYTLPGTRVYVTGYLQGSEIIIEMKNISSTELLVRPEELTERFVRGDSARNTDGSGLGLAIAKSFVELQGGRMMIQIDGDLFKVTTAFPIKTQD